MEQVTIFFEICGEFQPAYCKLRAAFKQHVSEGEDFSGFHNRLEITNIGWTDYPIANMFDLFGFYDRVERMLGFRIPIPRGYKINDFLDMCLP